MIYMHSCDRLEDMRLAALRRLGILDTPREKEYDDLVTLAGYLLEAPIALISLVDEDRQWFKACVGLDATETSRDVSFCSHAIDQDDLSEPLVVTDATCDPRFSHNPLVTGPPYIRMYAGVPLVTGHGHALGSLCVIDSTSREPTDRQLDALKTLGRAVVSLIDLRQATADLRESEECNRLIVDTAHDGIVTLTAEGRVTAWNEQAEAMFGWAHQEAIGRSVDELFVGSDELEGQAAGDFLEGLAGVRAMKEATGHIEMAMHHRDGSEFPAEVGIGLLQMRDGTMYSMFIRDITARKRYEQKVLQSATRDMAIFSLAKLAESRDPETNEHLERVRSFCKVLAEQLGRMGKYVYEIDDEFAELLYRTSPLHDVGKVGIPDSILLKPGRLSDTEFNLMKSHTTIGARTLGAALERFPDTPFLLMARDIAATHHERFDGTGYPHGLKGEQIPLAGRIVAVADVFDALSSKRVYKEAFAFEVAKSMIMQESGTHFDPIVVDAFDACESAFRQICERFSESRRAAA